VLWPSLPGCFGRFGVLQVKRLAGVTPANRKRAVIWASPPCTEYSLLKSGRPRNLEAADACVAAVQRVAAELDAAVVSNSFVYRDTKSCACTAVICLPHGCPGQLHTLMTRRGCNLPTLKLVRATAW
jgi:hypothetical protein